MAQPQAITDAAGEVFTGFAVVRQLGKRKVPVQLAHGSSPGGVERLVLERYSAALGLSPQQLDALASVARRLTTLRHPNLGLVRDVAVTGADVLVASEYIEGVTFEELRQLGAAKGPLPIEVGLRIIVDVLSGLSALHTTGGGLCHGEVGALDVLVGRDGITRLLRPYRGRVASLVAEPESMGYMAPEVLKGKAADVSADVFGAGVLLWEVLSRRKLFPKITREAMAARAVKIPKPIPPADAAWAAPLANVAERAVALDPAQRYATAAEMAAALRLIVRSRLAMPPKVSDLVERLASDVLARRRAQDAPPEDAASSSASGMRKTRPSMPPVAVKALDEIRPSQRPKTASEAFIHEAPTVPKAFTPIPKLAPSSDDFEPEPVSLGGLLLQEEAPKPAPKPSNRPVAPPLNLTPPVPRVAPAPAVPVIEPAPMPAPEPPPAPALQTTTAPIALTTPMPMPAAPEPLPFDEAPAPPARRRGLSIVIGAGALCLLLIAIAGIKLMLKSHSQASDVPSATTTATMRREPTLRAAVTAPASSATVVPSSPPTVDSSPTPETSAAPTVSGAPTPTGSAKRTPRPRPTYDPEGI